MCDVQVFSAQILQRNSPTCYKLVVVTRWSLLQDGRCCKVVVVARWSLLQGGRCCKVVVVARWSLLRGGRCYEVVVVTRWSLLQGGRCCKVVVVARWSLLRGGRSEDRDIVIVVMETFTFPNHFTNCSLVDFTLHSRYLGI